MIYLLEDDDSIRKLVLYGLDSQGFQSKGFALPSEFWRAMDTELPELVLLDIMLPEEDGISILKKLWADGRTRRIQVILLTAKGSEYDKVVGLDAGADDYLIKPFAFEELLARLRVLLRKPQGGKTTVLRVGELELHLDTRQVFRQGQEVRLSSKEFSLLRYMMQNAGIVLSREKLEQHVWDYGYSGGSNVIDVYIRYLRKKLDQGHPVKYIHTVRGAGYVLKEGEG